MTAVAAAPVRAARTRPQGFRRLLSTELRLFLREPLLLFWGLVFPLGLLVVLGVAGPSKPQRALGGSKFIVVYTPTVMMFTLTILALSALPAALASYRDKGYLRRLSTTPIGAARLLGAQIFIVLALAAGDIVLLALVSHFAFSVPLPRQVAGFILAVLLVMGAMLGLGTLVAAVAPSQRVAAAAGSLLFFPLMFFAGLWVPQAEMGTGLRTVSHYSPLGAGVPAVQNAIAGHWPGTVHLLVLAGYTIILCAAAARFFRWER
jgi:ABC-2 type transport system permease protein